MTSSRSLKCVFPECVCFVFSGWKCAKCEMRENLWLNLTDGSVLCGKWFFDGSGGNGHALEHYKETKFPLAVKLDTITPDGAGQCLRFGNTFYIKAAMHARHILYCMCM